MLPLWVLILSALLCVGAAGWLLATMNLGGESSSPAATSPATATATTPVVSPEASPEASPSASASATAAPKTPPTTAPPTVPPTTPAAEPERNIAVGVFNNSRVSGLARTTADKVRAAGWTVNGISNWRGSIEATTVYYPNGFKAQADLLAQDLGANRVMPSLAVMRTDRLTVILTGTP